MGEFMNYEREHLANLCLKFVERAVVARDEFSSNPDEVRFNSLALECMQAMNYFEAFAALVFKEKLGLEPLNYIQLVDLIMEKGIINDEESAKLKRAFHLRNKFAHKNYDINDNDLYEMVDGFKIIEKVIAQFLKKD